MRITRIIMIPKRLYLLSLCENSRKENCLHDVCPKTKNIYYIYHSLFIFYFFRTHMQDLKDVTNNVHYENYRCKKLAGVSSVTGQAEKVAPGRCVTCSVNVCTIMS